MQELAMEVGKDILKAGASVGAMTAVGAANFIPISQTSLIGRSAVTGALFVGASDIVDFLSEGNSKLLNMDLFGAVDDLVFFSGLVAVADVSGIGHSVYRNIDMLAPAVSDNIKNAAVNGTILSTGRFVSKYVKHNLGQVSPMLTRITNITTLLK